MSSVIAIGSAFSFNFAFVFLLLFYVVWVREALGNDSGIISARVTCDVIG